MLIKIVESVDNYETAIKLSCLELENAGSITNKYYPAILDKISVYGPYFCLEKDMAMPHASHRDGVLKTDMCVLKLNRPVDFLGKSISVLFTVCAKDNESHLDNLKRIADICTNREKLDNIIQAKTEKEIMREIA